MSFVGIDPSGNFLTLETDSGSHRFHAIWLRDNAIDGATRDASNGQRLITMADLSLDTTISNAEITDGALSLTFDPDGHQASYDLFWLENYPNLLGIPACSSRNWHAISIFFLF